MLNTTGLTIGLDQAVPVSKAELDAELDACLAKYQTNDDAPLSPALLTIAHKLAKKRGKTPAYKGINFGLVLQTHLPKLGFSPRLSWTIFLISSST